MTYVLHYYIYFVKAVHKVSYTNYSYILVVYIYVGSRRQLTYVEIHLDWTINLIYKIYDWTHKRASEHQYKIIINCVTLSIIWYSGQPFSVNHDDICTTLLYICCESNCQYRCVCICFTSSITLLEWHYINTAWPHRSWKCVFYVHCMCNVLIYFPWPHSIQIHLTFVCYSCIVGFCEYAS